jgi:hypothetical protein
MTLRKRIGKGQHIRFYSVIRVDSDLNLGHLLPRFMKDLNYTAQPGVMDTFLSRRTSRTKNFRPLTGKYNSVSSPIPSCLMLR